MDEQGQTGTNTYEQGRTGTNTYEQGRTGTKRDEQGRTWAQHVRKGMNMRENHHISKEFWMYFSFLYGLLLKIVPADNNCSQSSFINFLHGLS